MFVSPESVAEHAKVAIGLCRLVKMIPQRLLEGDANLLAEVYGLDSSPAMIATDLLAWPAYVGALIGRGDFTLADDGLQCLELYVSGNLGGWESAHYHELFWRIPLIRRFLVEHGLEARHRDPIRAGSAA